ncbi:MAG TPA: outer membrane beta-barrel protein [Vicinamibacterales bacterium]|nr:outer membrane beta-barrel protein [Vicinamibacterales bacterium]
MRLVPPLLAMTMVLVVAGAAGAQTKVGGTAGISSQASGDSDLPYLGRGFGGTAVGVIATIDHDWTRHFTIGGEVSTAGAISGDQSQRASGATNAFVSHHRDTVFSGTAKLGAGIGGGVRLAAVGGAGGAYRHTFREGTTASLLPPASRTPFSETVSDFVFAFTLGADVTFNISDHLALLAVGRFHQLHDDDRLPDGVVERGVSSRIYRAGIGAQWRF